MSFRSSNLAPFGALFVALLSFAPIAPAAATDDASSIAEASRRFSSALVAGDLESLGDQYLLDAWLLPAGKTVRGREAIREYFAPRPGRTQLEHTMVAERLEIVGDLAIDTGTWTSRWQVGEQEPHAASERYLVIWRRDTDGRWRMAYDAWHRSADPPSPATTTLVPELEPLRPFLGRTWKALVDAEKQLHDVSRWVSALAGRVVKIRHSVGDGLYGGETFVRWDAATRSLVYDYFTTAGFVTHGTMTLDSSGRLATREQVQGDAGGVTAVEAVFELLPDGTLRLAARMLRGDQWEDRPAVVYREDPAARVVLP